MQRMVVFVSLGGILGVLTEASQLSPSRSFILTMCVCAIVSVAIDCWDQRR